MEKLRKWSLSAANWFVCAGELAVLAFWYVALTVWLVAWANVCAVYSNLSVCSPVQFVAKRVLQNQYQSASCVCTIPGFFLCIVFLYYFFYFSACCVFNRSQVVAIHQQNRHRQFVVVLLLFFFFFVVRASLTIWQNSMITFNISRFGVLCADTVAQLLGYIKINNNSSSSTATTTTTTRMAMTMRTTTLLMARTATRPTMACGTSALDDTQRMDGRWW